MVNSISIRSLFLLSLIFQIFQLHAQTTKWTGAGGNNFWNNVANWTDSIPDASTDALIDINMNTIIVSFIATAKSITLTGSGTLFQIEQTGDLTVSGSSGIGIQSNAKFRNFGYIEIANTVSHGILCQDTFQNFGDIYIFDVENDAIQNTGVFINQHSGELDLEGPTNSGFNNLGLFENFGLLETNAALHGINNQDSIYNEGEIKVLLGTREYGIHNDGSIFNQGEIFVDSTNTLSGVFNESLFVIGGLGNVLIQNSSEHCFFNNFGTLIVETNGTLETKEANQAGYNGTEGIFVNHGNFLDSSSFFGILGNSSIMNNKNIHCFNAGRTSIQSNGKFENFDSIHINIANQSCILIGDTLYNHSNGVIEIDSNRTGFGIYTFGAMINDGRVEIKRSESGIFNFEPIINNGNIEIHKTKLAGMRQYDLFENTETGVIDISMSGTQGLESRDKLTNHGSIIIEYAQNDGIYNSDSLTNYGNITMSNIVDDGFRNFGYFSNESGGLISIDSIIFSSDQTDAFYNDPSGTVFNHGKVNIKDSEYYGLKNQGIFHNYNELEISNTDAPGIFNRDSLINHGLIMINDVVNDGFQNEDYFLNKPNGTVLINNTISAVGEKSDAFDNSENGQVVNEGILQIQGSEDYGLRNQGTFHNHNQIDILNTHSAAIFNRNTLTNHETGVITIGAINAPNGIFNDPGDLIQNDGEISLDGVTGIGVRNRGTFNITGTGIISTQNIDKDFWINDLGGILNCDGLMDIK